MADQLPSVQQQKLASVRSLLERMRPQILTVLANPRHVDMIVRVAMTAIQRNPALLDCDQRSLMGAIVQAAQLGLEPDDVRGLAYLVPYAKKVTLIPGYRGLLFLALQTEDVRDIYAVLVHKNDEFLYEQGSDPRIQHRPAGHDRGEVIAGYYTIVFKDGYRRSDIMWRDELDEIKKQALANKRDKDNAELPWNKWEEEMQKKSILRRAAKTLPQNSRLATAAELDAMADAGKPQNLELLVDPDALADAEKKAEEPKPQAPRKSDKAKDEKAQPSPEAPATMIGSTVPDGSLFGKGEPNGKITAATLEKLVEKMIRWDTEHGSKVAMDAMKERYKVGALSALTEAQAQEWNGLINASLGLPEGE